MAVTTIVFGLLMAAVSFGGWAYAGMPSELGQLSPVFAGVGGLLLSGLGALALNESMRKHAMHLAAALAALGFLASAGRFIVVAAKGGDLSKPGPISTAILALLCAAFVGLCVKSFVDARRRRKAGPVAAEAAQQSTR
jgi:hypothetical protein